VNFKRFREVQGEDAELCERKNRAYGDKNLTRFGPRGLVVRMTDKMERLINLVWNGKKGGDETAIETARDMENYAVLLVMAIEGSLVEGERADDEKEKRTRPRRRRSGR
jgi:hypothetical protein